MQKGSLLWIQQLAIAVLRVMDIVSIKKLLLGSKCKMSRIVVLAAVMIISLLTGPGGT